MSALRITPRAKTEAARANERRYIETTAKLARELGVKLIISAKAATRRAS